MNNTIKLREDFTCERYSSRRNMDLTECVGLRFSAAEKQRIDDLSWKLRVRQSDLIRSALIYVGIIAAPPDDTSAPEHGKDDTSTPEHGKEVCDVT